MKWKQNNEWKLSQSKNSFEHESLDIYLIYVKGIIFFSFVKRVKQVNGHFEKVEKREVIDLNISLFRRKGVKTTGLDDDHRWELGKKLAVYY